MVNWDDPEFREKMSLLMKRQHEDPEFRSKLIENSHTPEVEERRRTSVKEAHSRPEVKARHLEGMMKDRVCSTCQQPFRGPIVAHRCPECRLANELSNKWKVVAQLVARDGISCSLCGEGVDLFVPGNTPRGASIDHVVPRSRGGSEDFKNLALAHFSCNTKKWRGISNG